MRKGALYDAEQQNFSNYSLKIETQGASTLNHNERKAEEHET